MTADTPDHLPLRPLVFALLLSLHEEPRHGYAIMKAVNERLRYRAVVGPGTLYRTLKELREQGLVGRAPTPAGEDARRQYYRLTAEGRRAAALEAARMAELVDAARAGRLLPEPGG